MAKAKKDEAPEEKDLNTEETPLTPETENAPAASDELEAALKAEKEKFLRLAAEFDNYRKRSTKERETLYSEIQSDTIAKLLPVYDNLARALKMECSDSAFYKGVDMTMTQLCDILTKLGVTEIPAVGEPFNPDFHNAVMHVEDPAFGESTVAEEFEKGFKMGDKVIRFSMVKVAN
jgi:molecular chaperone GrpE